MADRLPFVVWDFMGTLAVPAEPVPDTYARLAAAGNIVVDPAQIVQRLPAAFEAAGPLCWQGGSVAATVPGSGRSTAVKAMARRSATGEGPDVDPPRPRPVPVPSPEQEYAWSRRWWRMVVAAALGFRAAESDARSDVPQGGLPDSVFDALWDHYADPRAWRLCPGVRDAMDAVAATGGTNAILSNNDARLRGVVAGLGLPVPPERVVVSSELPAAKPDPAAFRVGLARVRRVAGDPPGGDLEGVEAGSEQRLLLVDDDPANRVAAAALGWAVAERIDEVFGWLAGGAFAADR